MIKYDCMQSCEIMSNCTVYFYFLLGCSQEYFRWWCRITVMVMILSVTSDMQQTPSPNRCHLTMCWST